MAYVLIALLCLLAGAALGWLAAKSRSAAETAAMSARLEAARDNETRLEQSLRAVTADAAAQSRTALNELLAPLRDSLQRYEQHVGDVERSRLAAYTELRTQVAQVAQTGEALRDQTGQLVSALRAPQVRGRWGEHQLRRIVEAAGMLEHCDFTEQTSASIEDQTVRPDLVVRLAGGKHVVVDAKAPINAYLDALETVEESARDGQLDMHAKQLRAHVNQLSKKEYWRAFDVSPEFTVLFVPADAFLDAALQRDPSLLEHAFARDIVLATPATLVALLRTVAYSWRQEALAENAAQVHTLGKEMYSRLATMSGHLAKLGSSLTGAVTAYNSALGSLESRVLVTARKFAELGVSQDTLPQPEQIEVAARQVQHEALRDPGQLRGFDVVPDRQAVVMGSATVVHALWDRIEARDWTGVGALLAEDVVVDWPVTGERIKGRDNFVAVNREYPDGWSIKVIDVLAHGARVASEVEVPHVELGVFRVASFWTVRDGLIVAGREYWTDLGGEDAPQWRARFTEPMPQ